MNPSPPTASYSEGFKRKRYYSQKYQGRFTLSGWRISLNNRFNNRTEVFEAYFEISGAGPVLHLIRVDAQGIHYRLMRE